MNFGWSDRKGESLGITKTRKDESQGSRDQVCISLPFIRCPHKQLISLIDSWHDTQPVYSCDFQPIPPAQLKRILPFPQPHHSQLTPNSSNADVSQGSTPLNTIGHKSGLGPSSASTSGTSSVHLERSASQSAVDPTDSKNSSTTPSSIAGVATRQYRLATAGADKNVRVRSRWYP